MFKFHANAIVMFMVLKTHTWPLESAMHDKVKIFTIKDKNAFYGWKKSRHTAQISIYQWKSDDHTKILEYQRSASRTSVRLSRADQGTTNLPFGCAERLKLNYVLTGARKRYLRNSETDAKM